MAQLFRKFDVDEETPVQFVGVHPVRWRPEWGAPTAMFAEIDDPVYDAAPDLLAACERYFTPLTGVKPPLVTSRWYCIHCNATSEYPSTFKHDDDCCVQQALAAIAKAKGA